MWKVHRDLQRLNKQALVASKFAGGSMGFNARNTFVLRVEHPYVVRKLEKSLDMGELTFHAEKTACCRLQQETQKALNKRLQSMESDNFPAHYIIRYPSARELVLPPPSTMYTEVHTPIGMLEKDVDPIYFTIRSSKNSLCVPQATTE